MKSLKVSQRLSLGFALVIALMIAIALIGSSRLHLLTNDIDEVINSRYPKTVTMREVREHINVQARSLRNLLLLTDEAEQKKEFAAIEKSVREMQIILAELEPHIVLPEGKRLLAQIKDARDAYAKKRGAVLELIREGRRDDATTMLLNELRPLLQTYFDATDRMIVFQAGLMQDAGKRAHDAASNARILMLGLGAFATVAAMLAGWLIMRSLTRQLGCEPAQAMEIMERISQGDLSSSISSRTGDKTSLLAAMKRMQDQLARIVGNVRAGTETIAAASGQIAAGNQDLSSRTEQQASSLEKTASSMEELTSTVRQNADNALQANQLAKSASDTAQRGGNVVAQVIDTMGVIHDSAKKISDIISVIDGIAFQTNLLALNAAVEAARAGEQGRGFAVVASEVRTLAQRSAAAAKEIKALIGDSTEKVETGSKLVNQAGTTMEEVIASIRQVTDIMDEITAASREQAAGIGQVNDAITQMDQVTQQNAALVEESAAAAESLQQQAASLAQAVSVFRLDARPMAQAAPERIKIMTPPAAAPSIPMSPSTGRIPAPARAAVPSAGRAVQAKLGSEDDWEAF